MISSREEAIRVLIKWEAEKTPLDVTFSGAGIGLTGFVTLALEPGQQGVTLATFSHDCVLRFSLAGCVLGGLAETSCVKIEFSKEVALLLCEAKEARA